MSITSLNGGFSFAALQQKQLSDLKQAGLSESLAKTAQSELDTATQSVRSGLGNNESGGFDFSKIKDAVAKQLSTDVQSGKITKDQSQQISQALDQLGQKFGPGGAGGHPGGPGGPSGSDAQGGLSGTGGKDSTAEILLKALDASSSSHSSDGSTSSSSHHGSSHHQSSGSSSEPSTVAQYLQQALGKGLYKTVA